MDITIPNLIKELNLYEEDAIKVFDLVNGKLDPKEFASVEKYLSRVYNEPAHHDLVMMAIDEILATCGIEALRDEESRDVYALYCNTGHSDIATVVYDLEEDEYLIVSWANMAECHEERVIKDLEGENRSEILEGLATIFWVTAWGNHVGEAKCTNISGCDICDVMPDIPAEAHELAKKAAQEIEEQHSGSSLDRLYYGALQANKNEWGVQIRNAKKSSPHRFGECLAHMLLGSGVSWNDDNCEYLHISSNPSFADDLFHHAMITCEECNQEEE